MPGETVLEKQPGIDTLTATWARSRMKLAYVAGPYRSDRGEVGVQENIEKARSLAKKLWRKGYVVFCPQLNSGWMGGLVPDDVFLMAGLEVLIRCDIVVLVEGWEESEGTMRERNLALMLGIPVVKGSEV